MTLEEELKNIPKLTAIGLALAQFASSLTEGEFIRKEKKWVYRQDNFVAFTIQYARAKNIAVSLYGNFRDFKKDSVLDIASGRPYNYIEFRISEPRQLAAAANYIQRSFELYSQRHSKS